MCSIDRGALLPFFSKGTLILEILGLSFRFCTCCTLDGSCDLQVLYCN